MNMMMMMMMMTFVRVVGNTGYVFNQREEEGSLKLLMI